MPSQIDLDQGGTSRTYTRIWQGPSVGWLMIPNSVLPITAAGTYQINPSTTFVTINFNGPGVIIILPTVISNNAGAQAVPGLFAQSVVVIVDIGGFANANPITIKPFQSGLETIMGQASLTINSNFGGYTLAPNSAQLTWNSISP